jgi:hypothetical protein
MKAKFAVKTRVQFNIPKLIGVKVQLGDGRRLTIPVTEDNRAGTDGLNLTLAELEEVKGLLERGAVELAWS